MNAVLDYIGGYPARREKRLYMNTIEKTNSENDEKR